MAGDDDADSEATGATGSGGSETTTTIEEPDESTAAESTEVASDVESTDDESDNELADSESDAEVRESESGAESTDTGSVPVDVGEPERDELDHAAESFVEVEQELRGLGGGMRGRGEAVGVERVPTSEIPDGYPAEIDTEEALALQLSMVDADNQTVVVYFEWPEQGTDERLARLLGLRGIPMDRFADIHGETILLTIEDGYYVPVLPEEEPRGDDRGIYGIVAGLIPSLLIFVAGLFGGSSLVFSLPFFVLWLVATFVVLPVSVYLDAWDLRTTTDWDGGPLFWAFFAMVPALNVVAVPAYLIIRENAEPI